MDPQLSFGDLAAALAGNSLVGAPQQGFRVRSDEQMFVNPELLIKEGLGDLGASVILVSARGAAGKSRSAEELSRQLGAPLWKLEEDKAVGATSFAFVLGRYLGVSDAEEALRGLPSPTILVDSLDEARARVSGTSWGEFLHSLAEAARVGCRFVLFGRERTLEEAWVSFSDAGVTLAWLELSHFGREERLEYVDGRVASRTKGSAVTQRPEYRAARDAVLGALVGAVPDEAADTFAGYAPVLDAVAAVLYSEENYYAIGREFSTSSGGTRHLEELRRILNGLLERDQAKMAPLATQFGLDPNVVYSPDEQIDWLCHDLAGGAHPTLEHIGDPNVRAEYVKSVRPFVADHPFRNEGKWASAVFVAFVASKRFGTTFAEQTLVSIGNDSGLLFDFVSLDGEQLLVDEWQFAALHASITAGEFSGTLATVTLSEVDASQYEGTMSVVRAGDPAATSLNLLPEIPQNLRLFGPLEGLTVVTSEDVSIPARTTPTVLGPDLFVHCRSLAIEGLAVEFAQRAVPVRGEDQSTGMVTLEVEGVVHLPGVIARDPLPGDFELRVPESATLRFPWVAYRQPLDSGTTANPNDRAIRFLNMLMNLTRAHGHRGERGSFIKKLEGRQSVKGEEFRAVSDVLSALGVVRMTDEMIYIRADFEKHRFSGKTLPGQRLIGDVWDVWGPIVRAVSDCLR